MRWQKNMFQTKEQDKTPEEQLSDMELDNLPKKEFRVMTVKMIQELGKRMDAQREKLQEVLNKELENIESNQTELKNTITEMKNTLEGINSRINEAEEWVSQLEDRVVEIIAMEQNKEKRMKRNEDNLRDLWDNHKHTNIHIIRVSEAEKRKKEPEKMLEEIIAENFPNMGKETVTQVQEAQRVPGRINSRSNTLRHIVIKLTKIKDKEKTLKATREKQQIIYK